ncbi:MAG: hypothetical protein ACI4I6_05525 [Hominimerdicola sp.]
MADFQTLNGALGLFNQVGGIGNTNTIFMALRDTNREGMKYGMAAGFAAGMAVAFGTGHAIISGNAETLFNNNFDALLINHTERGLGFIPLNNKKALSLSVKIENLEPALNEYVFIPFEAVAEIKVKNFSFLNKKMQTVKIKFDDKHILHLLARKQEKSLPYQEENYAKIMALYGKK